jgi:hypothetical protein
MSTKSGQIDEQELDAALRCLDPALPRSLAIVDNLVDLTEHTTKPRKFTRRWRIGIATSLGAVALAVSLIAAADGAGGLFPLGSLAPGERWSTAYIVYSPPASAGLGASCEIRPTLFNLSDAQFHAIENEINDGNWGDLAQDVEARESAYAGQRGAYDSALLDVVLARLQTAVPSLSYGSETSSGTKHPGPRLVGLDEACGN